MSTKLIIHISKKIPGPLDFSSIQAACSIEGELSVGQDPVTEASKLYQQAERAVDAQLSNRGHSVPSTDGLQSIPVLPATMPVSTAPRATARPYVVSPTRRLVAPVTVSQLRFLDRLIQQTGASLPAILQQYQVGSLRDLTCKMAAGLIDELKAQGVPS